MVNNRPHMKNYYKTHGKTGTKIHNLWKYIHSRCKRSDPKTTSYKTKGITVCDEWKSSQAFIEWAESNGYQEGLQIDRINNDEGYSPDNCRFVTPQENANNRDNTMLLTLNGKTQSVWHWSLETGIAARVIRWRIEHGWDGHDAISKKLQPKRRPLINMETKEVFESMESAASSLGLKKRTLQAMLQGQNSNRTPIQYL